MRSRDRRKIGAPGAGVDPSNGAGELRRQRCDRSVDVVVGDVEMGHGAQPSGAKVAERDAGVGGPYDAVAFRVGNGDEVRLDVGRVDADAFRKTPSASVIVGEALDVVVERVERRGSE